MGDPGHEQVTRTMQEPQAIWLHLAYSWCTAQTVGLHGSRDALTNIGLRMDHRQKTALAFLSHETAREEHLARLIARVSEQASRPAGTHERSYIHVPSTYTSTYQDTQIDVSSCVSQYVRQSLLDL